MSFLGLNIAGSALNVFQEAEDVTAQNISNVQTPGASRQLVNIGQTPPIDGYPGFPTSLSPGTQGTGILISSITRVHQDSYDALFRGASSSQNYYSAEQGVLTALQSSFGEPSNGINSAFSAFQTAIQTLANNPQGTAEQTGVLQAAQGVVTSLNSANAALQTSELQTQTQAGSLISTINSTMDQIAALNGQIRAATAVGDNPNTYEDQRDQLIDTLSTYLPTTTEIQADGSTLVTVNGLALVNDTVAYHLAAPIVGTNPNGTTALQVDFVTPPNPTNPAAINITGGQLGGLLDTYNNKLLPYSDELNNFTNALATETDRISQAGYDSTGQAGGQLFSPVVTQLPISAGNIQVGIATPSEVPINLATTLAGTLVQPLNAGNATVDTTAAIVGNQTLANPPAAAFTGTLTVADDGLTTQQVFNYSTVAASSTSTASTAVGATTIAVGSVTGFAAGQTIVVGTGTDQEVVTIAAGGVNAVNNTLTFTTALANAHVAGEGVGGNAGTIGGFINSFNAEHFGVTASYDSTSQSIVFSRDPTNIDLVHRAAMQAVGGVTSPTFTITDSNAATVPAVLGTPATSLLQALGANGINAVQQNATNAYGSTSGSNVNALLSLFSNSFGVPALQTTSPTAIAAPGAVTIFPPPTALTAFAQVDVGDVLTIDAGTPAQENVTVTAVNRNNGSISFTAKNAHLANFSITSAQNATLQQSYASIVAQMGQDAAAATTGNTTQGNLATSINQVRQSTDGINVDEETQNLVKFQNAYGAAAHVISVLAAMLTDAVNLGGGSF